MLLGRRHKILNESSILQPHQVGCTLPSSLCSSHTSTSPPSFGPPFSPFFSPQGLCICQPHCLQDLAPAPSNLCSFATLFLYQFLAGDFPSLPIISVICTQSVVHPSLHDTRISVLPSFAWLFEVFFCYQIISSMRPGDFFFPPHYL